MGQAIRTTKLVLDLGERGQGGANTGKRTHLTETAALLTAARAFYIDFFLTHADKLAERVSYYSAKHLEMRERAISANELLTWAEVCTVATKDHPHPWPGWNFSERFPDLPFAYRRSVIKDAIGKVRSFLSNRANWEKSGKKKSKPGLPGASEHPTLYQGTCELSLEGTKVVDCFVRLKVYDGKRWQWVNYPVTSSRYFQQRLHDPAWDQQRYRCIKRIAKKQWLSGKPVAGERSNQQLWRHVRHMDEDAAHQVAHLIAAVCAKYPGCGLLFERLRKIKPQGASKSRRMNRRRSNQLRGKISQAAREKAYALGVVTVETNAHGTSQFCSRCGARGERFSIRGGVRIAERCGKLFRCPVCYYEAHADYNASVNVHHSFYQEWHWQPRLKRSG